MLIKVKNSSDFRDCDVTDEAIDYERRQFINSSAKYAAAGLLASYGVLPTIASASIDFSAVKKVISKLKINLRL